MAKAKDSHLLWSKHKAINALLPYAVWQDDNKKPEVLEAFLHVARVSNWIWFTWYRTRGFASVLLSRAHPQAIVLASPYIIYYIDTGDLLAQWTAAISVVPRTEQVDQSVVDTLLQIASDERLSPHINIDMWSWLNKQPSLPPICQGRSVGLSLQVIKAVQGLNDIAVLKSYLLIVWSEWDRFIGHGFSGMCTLIQEDFGGIEMGHHRADLIQRLDHILGELDRGLEHLRQHNPYLEGNHIQVANDQYGELKNILVKMNIDTITRMFDPMGVPLCTLIHMDIHRIPCNIYVCSPSPMSIAPHLEICVSLNPLPHSICTWSSIPMLIHQETRK